MWNLLYRIVACGAFPSLRVAVGTNLPLLASNSIIVPAMWGAEEGRQGRHAILHATGGKGGKHGRLFTITLT